MTTKSGCTKCGGIILADTEDWENPLCHAHWVDIGEPQNEPRCINPNLKSEFKICGDALEFVPRAKYQDLIAKHERVLQALEIAESAMNHLLGQFPEYCPICSEFGVDDNKLIMHFELIFIKALEQIASLK